MHAPLLLAVALAAADAPVQPVAAAAVDTARQALAALDFRAARDVAESALAIPGNDRTLFMELHEVRALTSAALGDEPAALDSFCTVLSLWPDYELPPDLAPRIRALYGRARAEVAQRGPLSFTILPYQPDGFLRVSVTNDPFGLGRRFRFHFGAPGGREHRVGGELSDGVAALEIPLSAERGWWGELLGQHDAVLARLGSPSQPLDLPQTLRAPSFAMMVPGWKPLPSALQPGRPLARIPPTSWALWAGAGATLLAGGILGGLSEGGRQQLRDAPVDDRGRVVGLSQSQALAIDSTARTQALVANILFGATAALAAGGGVAWWWEQSAAGGRW